MTSTAAPARLARGTLQRSRAHISRPPRRTFALEAATATPPPVRIVSRQSLTRHAADHPFLVKKLPPPPKIKDSSEVPWPLPMRIAGYTAMVLSIPYCGAHVVAGSPSVREWLEGDRPDLEDDCKTGKQIVALVRQYWGESEGLPYADRLVMEQTEHEGGSDGNGEEQIVDWTVLEADLPHDSRVQQGRIEQLKHRPVPVRATLVPPGSIEVELDDGADGDANAAWRGQVEGTVAANRSDLVTALGGAGWEDAKHDVTQAQSQGGGTTSVGLAAVDFDDDDDAATATTDATTDGGIRTDAEMDAFESSGYQIASDEDEATHLKRLTTTWSAWHHESSWSGDGNNNGGGKAAQSGSSSSSSSSSSARGAPSGADALQIATLEHQIAQLQADLKDPMCTRSFDDMERELKEARNELWRLKGGWGGKIRSALRL